MYNIPSYSLYETNTLAINNVVLLPVLVSIDCKTFTLDWLLLIFPNSLRDPTGYPSLSRHITTNDPSMN